MDTTLDEYIKEKKISITGGPFSRRLANFTRGGGAVRSGSRLRQRFTFNSIRGRAQYRPVRGGANANNSTARGVGKRPSNFRPTSVFFRPRSNIPIKLYIANLEFGVNNEDILELFSEFGPIRKYGVNYDQNGHSLGTAEIRFVKMISALRAVEKYNNVPLDGRPLKLAVSGPGSEGIVVSSMTRFKSQRPATSSPGRGMNFRGGSTNSPARTRGGITKKLLDRSRMNVIQRGRKIGNEKSEDMKSKLDADLEAYHAKTE